MAIKQITYTEYLTRLDKKIRDVMLAIMVQEDIIKKFYAEGKLEQLLSPTVPTNNFTVLDKMIGDLDYLRQYLYAQRQVQTCPDIYVYYHNTETDGIAFEEATKIKSQRYH